MDLLDSVDGYASVCLVVSFLDSVADVLRHIQVIDVIRASDHGFSPDLFFFLVLEMYIDEYIYIYVLC